jgi:osmotically-inducible protein OsmY
MERPPYETDVDELPEDDELQQRIAERIDGDAAFWSGRGRRPAKTQIEVHVEDGFVTLTGMARTASERRRADLLARALGARGVDNRLRVEPEADAKAS